MFAEWLACRSYIYRATDKYGYAKVEVSHVTAFGRHNANISVEFDPLLE